MKNYEFKSPLVIKRKKSKVSNYVDLICKYYDTAVIKVASEIKNEVYKNKIEIIKSIQ